MRRRPFLSFFFFNDTATTEIYTLSLHDALPISRLPPAVSRAHPVGRKWCCHSAGHEWVLASKLTDRKSTRLNSSHSQISYAVFCLKKKKAEKLHGARSCSELFERGFHRRVVRVT